MTQISRTVRKISHQLSEAQLRRIEDTAFISAGDFCDDGKSLFYLGYYSEAGIRVALKKYGVYEFFARLGYQHVDVLLDTSDAAMQRLAIVNHPENDEVSLLAEMVLSRKKPPPEYFTDTDFLKNDHEILYIEWLTLRNPRGSFNKERPRLPGQDVPGLGAARLIVELLKTMCWRLGLGGMINVPEYFHNAQLYSHLFKYLDPVFEGRRQAITRDLLSTQTLAEVSSAIDRGWVRENGRPFQWFTQPQLYPLKDSFTKYFGDSAYRLQVSQTLNRSVFTIDPVLWDADKKIQ